jgi:NAD(P)-dependent dehydrogenase (short-subunit alcohol dehydrogenase family)
MSLSESPPTVLITGASSGVGCSLVEHLKESYTVIAVARRLKRMHRQFGDFCNVHCYRLDVSDPDHIRETLTTIREVHGPCLHLVNNAGIMHERAIRDLDANAFLYSLRVNAAGPLGLMQELLGDMVAHNYGRIINLTSGAPLNCFPGYAAYSASKAALNALTVTAAREHAKQNIRINLMSPGPVRTEMAPDAPMEPSVCHPTVDYLLGLDADGPTGRFFWLGYELPWAPELDGVQWLEGTASEHFKSVI